MGYRPDRLVAAMKEKEWNAADLRRATGIGAPQIGRYMKPADDPKAGRPDTETIANIIVAMDLDANYLLDTDQGYSEDRMKPRRAAAKMSLDRYLASKELEHDPVSNEDERELQLLADHDDQPPVWVKDWLIEHKRARLRAAARPQPAEAPIPRTRRTRTRPS